MQNYFTNYLSDGPKLMKVACVAICATLLSSCGPTEQPFMYKPGMTNASIKNDGLDCELEATEKVQPAIQVYSSPVRTTPVWTDCDDYGCTSYGGNAIGGGVNSVDQNAGLRQRYFERCMNNRGYKTTQAPLCDRKITKKAYEEGLWPEDEKIFIDETVCVATKFGEQPLITLGSRYQ